MSKNTPTATTETPLKIEPSKFDFSAMHKAMQSYVDKEIIPFCTTLVMQGTDIIDVATFGPMDHETNRPLQHDSIFRMYSNTKIVTSVAAMMLWEEKCFDLDDPLMKYLPEFADMQVLKPDAESIDDTEPSKGDITIRQILSHTAGLSYGFIEPESIIDSTYMERGINALASHGMTLQSLCEQLGKLPLAYHPGTRWRYSYATDVTARLIEVVSGQRFDEFLKERIFDPLNMVDTAFFVAEEKRDRFTTMYMPDDPLDPISSGYSLADDPNDGTYTREPSFLSGGGGLTSTLVDYITFIQMIVNGGKWNGTRFLKASTLDLMRTNQCPENVGVSFPFWDMKGTAFGLGFALKQSPAEGEPDIAIDEYHWGGMAGTHSWMSPRSGITGICMTQRMPGFWHPFSHDFKRLVYQAVS